jgi:phosphoribosylamine--glycine ligase/phosphoribosylformylglycinamidine cyclo-ligase
MPPSAYTPGASLLANLYPKDVVVFHAGTAKSNSELVTTGGRVMAITAYAPTLQDALNSAYDGVNKVTFEGKTYRRDIAHR